MKGEMERVGEERVTAVHERSSFVLVVKRAKAPTLILI